MRGERIVAVVSIEEAERRIADWTGGVLDLSHLSLTTVPDTIGNLTHLTDLLLNNNQLTTIPEAIGNLTQLTDLRLYGNQLTAIPEEIGNLKQLAELSLSGNQLTTIPDTIGNLTQLTELRLDGNQLAIIPDTIGNLTQLHGLRLYVNELTTLPATITNLGRITNVDISDQGKAGVGTISLGGNRWSDGFRQAAEQGIDALWEYLRNHNPDDEQPTGSKNATQAVDDADQPPVTPSDVEIYSALPLLREAELRKWLEPLLDHLSRAIDEGDFGDDEIQKRRAEQDRDYLHAQLYETDVGELRTPIVVSLAQDLIRTLAPVSDEPGATEAARLVEAGEGPQYGPEQFVAQRDQIAAETSLSKSEADKALLGFTEGIAVVGSVTTIYAAYETGFEPGVLFGAAVAIAVLVAKRVIRR